MAGIATTHLSKASNGGMSLKNGVSSKLTDSLVSVMLSKTLPSGEPDSDSETPMYGEREITMHFPDEVEIARSSMGATEEIPLTPAEERVLHSDDINTEIHKTSLEDTTGNKTTTPHEPDIYLRASQTEHKEDEKLTDTITQCAETEDTPKPTAQRTSKVRFDIDDIPTDPISISKSEILLEQEENTDNKFRSDLDLSPTDREGNPLDVELARNSEMGPAGSDSGSESESELVDWQELDRTEVEEKRDGATGEVRKW